MDRKKCSELVLKWFLWAKWKIALDSQSLTIVFKRGLWLTEQAHMKNIEKRFGMTGSKSVAAPMKEPIPKYNFFGIVSDLENKADDVLSCKDTGCLTYPHNRNQAKYSIFRRKNCRFLWKLMQKHWTAVKRALWYVNGMTVRSKKM